MYDDLSATDERILFTLNDHVSQGDHVSITTVAEECSVAKSTVVKLAKKLGYHGFSDLRDDLARGRRDTVSDTYLPMSITDFDDALEDATRMAQYVWENRFHKNVLVGSTSSAGRLLSSYLERKLFMFNIAAASTYDYATIMPGVRQPGFALFYEHNASPKAERGRISLTVSRPHFRLAQKSGYTILLVNDTGSSARAARLAHDTFRIKRSNVEHADLFVPRTIMLFELMLSELARMAREDGSSDEGHNGLVEDAITIGDDGKSGKQQHQEVVKVPVEQTDVAVGQLPSPSPLTSRQRTILETIRNSVGRSPQTTITEAAREAECAPSTITTLARRLGYSGWPEMRDRFAAASQQGKGIAPTVQRPQVDQVAEILLSNQDKAIFVDAMGDGAIAGSYLESALAVHGFNSLIYEKQALLAQARQGRAGVLFIINESGVVLANDARIARDLGFTVVALTGIDRSPVARLADVLVLLKSNKSKPQDYNPDFYCARAIVFSELLQARLPYLYDSTIEDDVELMDLGSHTETV